MSLSSLALAFPSPSARAAAAARGLQEVEPKVSARQIKGDYVPGEVLVRFRSDVEIAAKGEGRVAVPLKVGGDEISISVERFGGSDLIEGLRLARVAPEDTLRAIDALNARPDVLYAEPNYIRRPLVTPNDPAFFEQWGLRNTGQANEVSPGRSSPPGIPGSDIKAEAAWNITTGSKTVVVGVVDTGIDVNHADLKDNMWVNPSETPGNGLDDDGNGCVDDVNGCDFTGSGTPNGGVFDSAVADDHGTHVAGIIGARGNNGIGVTGVNWQVSIMSIKVIGADGGSTADIVEGYNYAIRMKERGVNLRVLNNSFGGPGFTNSERDAVSRLADAGILFVAAAGNDATDNFNYPQYPSDFGFPNVINVAATTRSDALAPFSNFGARAVSIGAPGATILSTTPRNYNDDPTNGAPVTKYTGPDGSTYSYFSGTSMASPHVAGAAALVVAARPDISMQRLRGVLAYSGDFINSLQFNTTTGRRLNVYNSILSAQENDNTAPSAASNLHIESTSGRTVQLAWNAPGDDGTSGTAADYDVYFLGSQTGAQRLLLPTAILPKPAGSAEGTSVTVPLRNFSGTIILRTYDNVGNFSEASIPVTLDVNAGTDPYTVTSGAAGGLSTGGTRLTNANGSAFEGDDVYRPDYALPFQFSYFGQLRSVVTVSTNGALYFSTPPRRDNGDADDADSSILALRGQTMIAGMWDDLDLRTCMRSDAGVYVVQPESNRIIFRWQGVRFQLANCPASPQGEQINFEIELRNDGTIIFRYGDGNTNLFPVVGISAGEPDPYVITQYTSERGSGSGPKNLTNAASIIFTRRVSTPTKFKFDRPFYGTNENLGHATLTILRVGDTGGTHSVTITNEASGTATPNVDFTPVNQTITFGPGQSFANVDVPVINDNAAEFDESVRFFLSNPTNGATLDNPSAATLTITSDDAGGANTVQFAPLSYTVGEAGGHVTLNVTRTGDTSAPATVLYDVTGGTASDRSDYSAASGTLRFAANETSKSIDIFITDDRFDEPDETLNVSLSGGMFTTVDSATRTATITITDNDAANGLSPVKNGSFDSEFFVRQHYIDFFNREPDASGLAFWKNQIDECEQRPEAERQGCREVRRINVSAAFFVSTEFQETGYFVYKMYQAAYGQTRGATVPLSRQEFLPDLQQLGRGVIVGQGNWQQQLEQNKQAYADQFLMRTGIPAFNSTTVEQFVDTLNQNVEGVLTQEVRNSLVNRLGAGQITRAQALREVAENAEVSRRFYNRAFVLMEYFGYLRRNPFDAPEETRDFAGYNFWLNKLNQFGGNYITSEMVKGFITSTEYQQRFGQ